MRADRSWPAQNLRNIGNGERLCWKPRNTPQRSQGQVTPLGLVLRYTQCSVWLGGRGRLVNTLLPQAHRLWGQFVGTLVLAHPLTNGFLKVAFHFQAWSSFSDNGNKVELSSQGQDYMQKCMWCAWPPARHNMYSITLVMIIITNRGLTAVDRKAISSVCKEIV